MRLVQVAFSLTMVVVAIASSAACSVASIPGTGENTTNVNGGGGASSGGTTGPNAAQACINGEPEKIDITKLNACECKDGGKAHCVGAGKMPTNLASRLNRCDGEAGRCIPDTIITSQKPPTACKTGANKDGRCLSLCIPHVSQFAAGSCGQSDERCVPCVDNFGDPTGICNDAAFDTAAPKCEDVSTAGTKPPGTGIGTEAGEPLTCPFSGTPKDPSNLPTCGSGGRCVGKDGIPEDIAKRLRTCDEGLCVPEVYVREKGQHKPSSCSSFAGIEGRCFSLVFKDVDEQKEFLQRDKCNEDERCVPCFSPSTGAETQVCRSVKCDAPVTQTPPKLPDCCKQPGTQKTTGKCLPKSDIPTKFQERVDRHECGAAEVCAPSENLDPSHVTVRCDDGNTKKVCVSNCVEFGFIEGFFVGRGTCDTEHVCVPCFDITGAPTGAPGC